VKTTRFEDDGSVLVAVGELGEAYAPSCARDGCKDRSVTRLTRSFVFVRPSLLVVSDDIALERASYGVTWAAHLTRAPVLNGDLASAVVGESRVDVRTLEPREARRAALREPTPSGEGSHRANKPWGPMWRLEVESPRSERERRFLHVVSAGRADAPAPEARALALEGASGARIEGEGRRTVVLFARGAALGPVALGGPADAVVVVGLEPGRSYVTALEGSCSLRLTESKGTGSLRVGAGGFLRVSARSCGQN
jgi:hypothetical protein